MDVLHVAALPFPTRQGTQAVIASMLRASAADGRAASILTYGGTGSPGSDGSIDGYDVYRAATLPGRDSLRSGPSVRKLFQDVRLLKAVRALRPVLRPELLIGHHVEGAAACLATGAPTVLFAHTDLRDELPSYFPPVVAAPMGRLGGIVDRALLRSCTAVATISPLLQQRFADMAPRLSKRIHYVPPPWPVAPPAAPDLRYRKRRELGIDAEAPVLLYAGNLDAYQGIDVMLSALALCVRELPNLHLLVASDSDASQLRAQASAAGLGQRLHLLPLDAAPDGDEERLRCEIHAAADIAIVPRVSSGGLPIKLLDALSRGAPTVAMPDALAGVEYGDALVVPPGDDAPALGRAILETLSNPQRMHRLSEHARQHVATHHSRTAFLQAFDACCDAALGG